MHNITLIVGTTGLKEKIGSVTSAAIGFLVGCTFYEDGFFWNYWIGLSALKPCEANWLLLN